MSRLTWEEKKISRKKVLNEEDYVGALEQIIERDFFPETAVIRNRLTSLEDSKSRATNQNNLPDQASSTIDISNMTLDKFANRYTSEDNASFEDIQKQDIETHRRKFHWLYDPTVASGQDPGMLMLYHVGGKELTGAERDKMDLILNSKGADTEDEKDDRPNGPELWKFRVRNQLMFPIDLDESRDICDMPPLDPMKQLDKVKQLDKIEKKDDLLTIEEPSHLLVTRDPESVLPLNKGATSTSTELILQPSDKEAMSVNPTIKSSALPKKTNTSLEPDNKHVGLMLPPEKRITHQNTRINRSIFALPPQPSPLEAPHTPSILSEAGSSASASTIEGIVTGREDQAVKYRTVNMTPSPMPGGLGGVSPLMTWGELCGTPLALDGGGRGGGAETLSTYDIDKIMFESVTDTSPMAGAFQIKAPSLRESLGHSLAGSLHGNIHERAKHSKAKHRGSSSSPWSTPLTMAEDASEWKRRKLSTASSSHSSSTPSKLTAMSPAAQALAMRLGQNTLKQTPLTSPFGSTGGAIFSHDYSSTSRHHRHDHHHPTASTVSIKRGSTDDNVGGGKSKLARRKGSSLKESELIALTSNTGRTDGLLKI